MTGNLSAEGLGGFLMINEDLNLDESSYDTISENEIDITAIFEDQLKIEQGMTDLP